MKREGRGRRGVALSLWVLLGGRSEAGGLWLAKHPREALPYRETSEGWARHVPPPPTLDMCVRVCVCVVVGCI